MCCGRVTLLEDEWNGGAGSQRCLVVVFDCFVRIVGEVMGGRNGTHGGGEHIRHCFDSSKGDHDQQE